MSKIAKNTSTKSIEAAISRYFLIKSGHSIASSSIKVTGFDVQDGAVIIKYEVAGMFSGTIKMSDS